MSRKIVSMQIRVTDDLRERAKAVAKQKGLTLSELMLQLLASTGDKQLKDLVKKELKERPKPGQRGQKRPRKRGQG